MQLDHSKHTKCYSHLITTCCGSDQYTLPVTRIHAHSHTDTSKHQKQNGVREHFKSSNQTLIESNQQPSNQWSATLLSDQLSLLISSELQDVEKTSVLIYLLDNIYLSCDSV